MVISAALSLVAALSASPVGGCDLAQLERTVAVSRYGYPLESLTCYRGVPGAAAHLVAVLEDARRVQSWPMTVAVLGVIGDGTAYDALVAFLSQQRTSDAWGRMSPVEFSSKVDTILMVDYVRRYSTDDRVQVLANSFLQALVMPEGWRQYTWTSPKHASRPDSESYLAAKTRFALRRKTIAGQGQ